MSSLMIDFAKLYTSIGWHVVPCYPMRDKICGCGRPQCVSPGKHPATNNGLTDATTNLTTIEGWWNQAPDASIAVVMEPSGLCALDLDLYHSDLEKLAALEQLLGPLPLTVTQRSGSGDGFHIVFKSPGFPVRGVIGGIVVRSKAYIIVAPSNHASGGNYAWQEGLGPGEIAVAEFPDKWKEALRKTAEIGKVGAPSEEPEWLAKIPAEQRIADMKAHFAREAGEIKGTSTAGTTFSVVRSAIRAHAVRDSEAALEAALEFDKKCTPPWGARMARHVWSAYSKAHTPVWGSAYRGEEQRLEALGLNDVPVAKASKPAGITDKQLRADLQDIANTQSKGIGRYNKDLIKHLLKGGTSLGEDKNNAITALVQNTPAGATDEQLAAFLVSCFVPGDEALAAIREARGTRAPSATLGALTTLAESLPVSEVSSESLFDSLPTASQADVDDLPPPANDRELEGRLTMSSEGDGIDNCPHNLYRILRWAEGVRDCIRFNLLTKHIEITDGRFFGKNENTLPTHAMVWLSARWGLKCSPQQVKDILLMVARDHDYNPIEKYLNGLVWDGVRRLDTWLIDYCGAEDTEFTRRVSSMWMISACARGIQPGAKVDTVLVLEGIQGAKKSQMLRLLGGAWFSDTPLVIGNKDSLLVANSRWIIELAELSSLRSSETEAQKAFISACIDNFRPPYGAAMEEFPRFAIFGGSTNDNKYLIDATGNRRYWPVCILKCDLIGMKAIRDQLWAEATFRYKSAELNPHLIHDSAPGERWWFEDEDELAMAAAEVAKRKPENTWASILKLWVVKPTMVGGVSKGRWSVAELAHQALDIDIEKLPRVQKSIIEAIKEAGLRPVVENGVELWERPDNIPVSQEVTAEQLAKSN